MKFGALITPLTVAMLALFSCQPTLPNSRIEVVDEYAQLEDMFESDPEKIWVVNFWATSCPPCIKEMPHFRQLESVYADKNVRILLVSTDKIEDLESRVYPFVKKYEITPEVVLLGDQNYSAWTDDVDPSWYGALPATMIFHHDQKSFRFGAYKNYAELEGEVRGFIN